MGKSSFQKKIPFYVLLTSFNVFVIFLIGELSLRMGDLSFKNLIIEDSKNLMEQHLQGLHMYHPYLGWMPKPDVSVDILGAKVRVLENGIRSNGDTSRPKRDKRILAIGDSMTFGHGVNDNETWPAYLEQRTHYEVINAGVSDYGFDQMALRYEKLKQIYQPDIVIVSFILEDIRDQLQRKAGNGVPKPYFNIKNGKLFLTNSPVPDIKENRLDWVRSFFGKSFLVHAVMSRIFPEYWYKGTLRDFRVVKVDTLEVAQKIIDRIVAFTDENVPIIFLIQDGLFISNERMAYLEPLLTHIKTYEKKNVILVNLQADMAALKENQPEKFRTLFNFNDPSFHMNQRGNLYVAEKLAEILK